MHYSKRALLLFGAGGVLGLVVVSANLSWLGRIASLAMASGLALLPFALVADWWSYRPWNVPKPKPRARRNAAKRRSPARQRAKSKN